VKGFKAFRGNQSPVRHLVFGGAFLLPVDKVGKADNQFNYAA